MKSTGTSPEKSLIWRQYVNTMHSLKVSEFNQPDDLVASNRLCICIFCTIRRRAMAYFRIRKVKRIPWNGNMEVVHNENLSSKRLRWSSLISLTNIDLQSTIYNLQILMSNMNAICTSITSVCMENYEPVNYEILSKVIWYCGCQASWSPSPDSAFVVHFSQCNWQLRIPIFTVQEVIS